MANKKVSELTETTYITGSDYLLISQDGESKKIKANTFSTKTELNDELTRVQVTVNPNMSQNEIQNIINNYRDVKFIEGTYSVTLVDGCSFSIPSNTQIEFANGVNIELSPQSSETYQIFKLNNAENVSMVGKATIKGDREYHLGTTGEWGFGISIRGSKNITLKDIVVKNCWGDGLYIGSTSELNYCENIVTENITCDNNRRQGLSLISCKGYMSINDKFINTNGADPQAGVDIEPNNTDEFLQNIVFKNPYTFNNTGAGFHVHTNNLDNSVTLIVESLIDDGSKTGINIDGVGCSTGIVEFNKPVLKNSKTCGIVQRNSSSTKHLVRIDQPYIIGANTLNQTSSKYGSSIAIFSEPTDDTIAGLIGNIEINSPTFDSPNSVNHIYVADLKGVGTQDINIDMGCKTIDKLEKSDCPVYLVDKVNLINFNYPVNVRSSLNINCYSFGSLFTTIAEVSPTLTLKDDLHIGTELTFVVGVNDYYLNITTSGADKVIYPLNVMRIRSKVIGSSITLKKVDESSWRIVNQIGDWSTY